MFTIDTLMELVGTAAALLTTASFVPQVVKVWRTKRADDLSLIMYLMFWVGVALWLAYGIHLGSFSITVGNGVTLTLATVILYFKLRYSTFTNETTRQAPTTPLPTPGRSTPEA